MHITPSPSPTLVRHHKLIFINPLRFYSSRPSSSFDCKPPHPSSSRFLKGPLVRTFTPSSSFRHTSSDEHSAGRGFWNPEHQTAAAVVPAQATAALRRPDNPWIRTVACLAEHETNTSSSCSQILIWLFNHQQCFIFQRPPRKVRFQRAQFTRTHQFQGKSINLSGKKTLSRINAK